MEGCVGYGQAFILNVMLFVPMGYLLLLSFPQLREKRHGRVHAVLISAMVSMIIESLREITSLGMTDWKDVVGNTLGAVVGVGMVKFHLRFRYMFWSVFQTSISQKAGKEYHVLTDFRNHKEAFLLVLRKLQNRIGSFFDHSIFLCEHFDLLPCSGFIKTVILPG
ncbi:MAG: VanZ family protein [Lachnospiraceae bacterium]